MELILLLFAVLIFLLGSFLVIEYPYHLVFILIFLSFYSLNIELPGPLDLRGIITLVLLGRLIFFDKENLQKIFQDLLRDRNIFLIILFLLLSFTVTYFQQPGLGSLLKSTMLSITSLTLGFVIIQNPTGRSSFLYGIILTGLISTFDLAYSSFVLGKLEVTSLIKSFLMSGYVSTNHNEPGLYAGLALIVAFFLHNRYQEKKKLFVTIIGILTVGVLLSTSRSSALGLIVVFLIMAFVKEYTINFQKIVLIVISVIFTITIFFFSYSFVSKAENNNSMVDKLYYRLFEEPLSMFGYNKTKKYGKYSGDEVGGSIQFRLNKLKQDTDKYTDSDLSKQLFGFGIKGYEDFRANRFGNTGYLRNFNAHNGYLLILIERGLVGLILFIVLLISLSFKSLKYNNIMVPSVYLIIVIATFAIGQNNELTSPLIFLIFGTVIGEYLDKNS